MIENITKAMQADRAFIIAAVSCDSINLIKEKFASWLDNNGHIPYYELVIEIVDELMFTEGSEYLKFVENDSKWSYFEENHKTCMDWYFMDQARKEFEKRLGSPEINPYICPVIN